MPNTAPLCFSRYFKKLDEIAFSTIRRNNKNYEPGQIRWVSVNGKWLGKAEILFVHQKTLAEMPDAFLLSDTDTKTREDAIKLLNSFYETPIGETEKLTIVRLAWVRDGDQKPSPYAIMTETA